MFGTALGAIGGSLLGGLGSGLASSIFGGGGGGGLLSTGAGLLSGYMGSNAANEASEQQQRSALQAMQYQQAALGDITARQNNAFEEARREALQANAWNRGDLLQANAWNRGDQLDALSRVAQGQRGAADQAVGYLQPYMNMGTNATNTLTGMYSGGTFNPASFNASPDYNWRFAEGERALGNLQRARGGFQGGNATLDTIKYAQGAASQEFGNYFDRLMRMSGAGQQAAGRAGQYRTGTEQNIAGQTLGVYNNLANQQNQIYGNLANQQAQTYANIGNQRMAAAGNINNAQMQGANAVGGYLTGAGQAAAAGTVGAANAWSGGIQNGINNGLFLNAYANRNAGGMGGTPLGNYMSQGGGTGYATNPWSPGGMFGGSANTGILNYGPGY